MKILSNSKYTELVRLADELKSLRQKIEKEKGIAAELASNLEVAFDFNNPKVNPYSIERIPPYDGRVEHTLICYFNESGSSVNWFCYCNHQKHDELVGQFNEYLAARRNKAKK